MSLYDNVVKLMDEALEERINVVVNEYAEKISKKHGIPLEQLLKDIPESYTITTCKGTKNNGRDVGLRHLRMGIVDITPHRVIVYAKGHFQAQEVFIITDLRSCL